MEPGLDSFIEQLDYSINQINNCANEQNIIFDRCPVDFVAYAMCALDQESIDINDSEVSERFSEIKVVLNNLDLIVFLPISKENSIEYIEENPTYRKAADKNQMVNFQTALDGLPFQIQIVLGVALGFHVIVFGLWFFLVRKEIAQTKEKQS